ncbi:29804_t:CDS:2 [Gigaspora margarita]|uniref:29804_t:CDS:1 n=1 Tax=Gigaspora margarita TaxID=4874 RepID=A0ABN7VSN0_GIGMA|nr:29804_t:CDS:2 [Gigaspora margarita]
MYEELPDEELFGPGDFSDSGELEVDNIMNEAESHENDAQLTPDPLISSNSELQKTVFPSIPGLFLYKNLLTQEQQNKLVDAIINEGYFERPESNQAMCFGTLPPFIMRVVDIIENISSIFPDEIKNRKPLFDQSIINVYKPGDGINSHVDLDRFEDGIVIISLLSACAMKFIPAYLINKELGYSDTSTATNLNEVIPVILRPGDVLAMSGPARYDWAHGIEATKIDIVGDERIVRKVRVSITLRKMKEIQVLNQCADN